MDIKKMLHYTSIGHAIDTIKNISEEGSVVNGIKRAVKEDMIDYNPIGHAIYNEGIFDGKKEGYAEASDEYERKLLAQADEFLRQEKDFARERDEYETLLDEYEEEIEELENKVNKTQEENEMLQRLLLKERNLKKLAGKR